MVPHIYVYHTRRRVVPIVAPVIHPLATLIAIVTFISTECTSCGGGRQDGTSCMYCTVYAVCAVQYCTVLYTAHTTHNPQPTRPRSCRLEPILLSCYCLRPAFSSSCSAPSKLFPLHALVHPVRDSVSQTLSRNRLHPSPGPSGWACVSHSAGFTIGRLGAGLSFALVA